MESGVKNLADSRIIETLPQSPYSKSINRYDLKQTYAQIYSQIQKQRQAKIIARGENQANWKLILASQKKCNISEPMNSTSPIPNPCRPKMLLDGGNYIFTPNLKAKHLILEDSYATYIAIDDCRNKIFQSCNEERENAKIEMKITKILRNNGFRANLKEDVNENFNNLKNEINSRSCNNSSMRAKEKFNQTFSKLLSRNIINQVLPQKLKSNENTDSAIQNNKLHKKNHNETKKNKNIITNK